MSKSMNVQGPRRCVVLVLLALLVVGASVAQATTVKKMTFSEVVNAAELIAVGVVTVVQDTWDAEREMPFTEVTFSELEVFKGEVAAAELTLRFLGGPAPDGLTLDVGGMPKFAVGDRVVVFSSGNGVRACPLVGWWQGVYRLLFDAARDVFTVADHAGRPVVAIEGGLGRMTTRLSARPNDEIVPQVLTLAEFRTVVGAALR